MSSAPTGRSARELAGYGARPCRQAGDRRPQQDRRDRPGRGDAANAARWPRAAGRGATVLPLSGVSGAGLHRAARRAVAAIERPRADAAVADGVDERDASSSCPHPTLPAAVEGRRCRYNCPPPLAGEGRGAGVCTPRRSADGDRRAHAAPRLVVKIGSALLVGDDGEIRRAWLDALVDDVARCRRRGQEVDHRLVRRDRGRAAASRPARPRAAARGKAGGGGDRADPPRACLSGGAGAARHHRRADPADPRRHRGAAPPPQRPRHLRAAAGAGRGAGGQRERHDRHRRNPLWRQRPARRPRRADDQRRHAGAAVATSTGSTPPTRATTRRRATSRWSREIGPEIEAMAGAAPPRLQLGRHGDQARRGADRDERRLPHADRQGRAATADGPAPARSRRSRPARKATLFLPRGEPRSARKAWIAGAVNPAGALIVDDGAARALRQRQEPAAGRRRRGRGRLRARRLRDHPHHAPAPRPGAGFRPMPAATSSCIAGHKSGEIAAILGYRGRDEIIHRDDLVLTETR